jgi:hypothetical protein
MIWLESQMHCWINQSGRQHSNIIQDYNFGLSIYFRMRLLHGRDGYLSKDDSMPLETCCSSFKNDLQDQSPFRDLSSNENNFWPTGRNSSESTPDVLLSETGASIFGSSDGFGTKRCKM